LYALAKGRAIYVFVTDIALVSFGAFVEAMTGQGVKGVVLLSDLAGATWAKEVILAELAFIADVATTLAKAVHVFGVATCSDGSKSLVVLITPHVAPAGVRLFARPTDTPDGPISLLSAALCPRTFWILLAVAWCRLLTSIIRTTVLPLLALLPFYLIIAARIRLVVASVTSVNLGAFTINTGVTRPTVITRSAIVIASPSV